MGTSGFHVMGEKRREAFYAEDEEEGRDGHPLAKPTAENNMPTGSSLTRKENKANLMHFMVRETHVGSKPNRYMILSRKAHLTRSKALLTSSFRSITS